MEYRKQMTINGVLPHNMRTIFDSDGNITPIESNYDLPFHIKRVFYVYGVDDQQVRGKHAHFKTKQLLICLNGEIEVTCKDGLNEKKFLLGSKSQGLYIPEMIWDEQIYKQKDSLLLVLASTKYNPDDYIHNYEEFKKLNLQ